MTSPPKKTSPRQTTEGALRIEDVSEVEQDATFDDMVRSYKDPPPDVVARYAEIGQQTQRALEQATAPNSPSSPKPCDEDGER